MKKTDEPAATPAATNCTTYLWLLLILNAAAAAYGWYRERDGGKSLVPYAWLIGLLLAVVPVILWYPACWLVTWLVVTLIILIIVAAMTKKQSSIPQPPANNSF